MIRMNLTLPDVVDDLTVYDDDEPICGEYETYTLARFLFIFVSSWIALFGTMGNLFLLYLFSARNYPNTPPTLYPGVLAILDSIICAMYILLFGADAAIVFLHIESLFVLYYIYVIPAFVISRITQLAIPYMLIFATLERFVWIAGNMKNRILRKMYSVQGRFITIGVSLSCCVLLRIPTALATSIVEYPKCDDFFRSKTTSAAKWVFDNVIYQFYDFHLLSIAQTVVPFFVLLIFNVIIIKRVATMDFSATPHKSSVNSKNSLMSTHKFSAFEKSIFDRSPSVMATEARNLMIRRNSMRRMNPAVKSAIYTMLAIVTSYLVSNTLHLVLSVLERSDSDLLKHPTDPKLASTFHTVFSDLVSFVYMFTSAIRLVIYYVCNPAIRADIKTLFKNCCIGQKEVKDMPVNL